MTPPPRRDARGITTARRTPAVNLRDDASTGYAARTCLATGAVITHAAQRNTRGLIVDATLERYTLNRRNVVTRS